MKLGTWLGTIVSSGFRAKVAERERIIGENEGMTKYLQTLSQYSPQAATEYAESVGAQRNALAMEAKAKALKSTITTYITIAIILIIVIVIAWIMWKKFGKKAIETVKQNIPKLL